eukprot:1877836-Amphidinium_carterae.1
MQFATFDTWRNFRSVSGKFHISSLLMPVRASEDDVGEILRLLLTTHTELTDMKSTICAYLMPDSSNSIGTALQVPVALCAEAGFQASKIWASSRHLCKQGPCGVPLDLVVRFTPSEVLVLAAPATNCRCPGK